MKKLSKFLLFTLSLAFSTLVGFSQTTTVTANNVVAKTNLYITGHPDSVTIPTGGVLFRDFTTGNARLVPATITFYGANGITFSGDTMYLGNSLIQNTVINTMGFTYSILGLPNKTTLLSTDSVIIKNAAGVQYVVPASAIGSSGGFTNPMTSVGDLIVGTTAGAAARLGIGANGYILTSNGTTAIWSAPAASQNFQSVLTVGSTLTTANTITLGTNNFTFSGTGIVAVNAPFSTNSTVNLTGLAYSAGGSTFDVVVQDTSSGKVWRQPYYPFSTSNFSSSDSALWFNGTQIYLHAPTTYPYSVTTNGTAVYLSNDAATPGNSEYYGTNSSGTKGWYALPSSTGMTNPMTTTGDMIYSSSGSTPARLGIGSTSQILTVVSGIPAWAAPVIPTLQQILTSGGTITSSHVINVGTNTLEFTGSTPSVNYDFADGAYISGLSIGANAVGANYTVTTTDNYIGVSGTGTITITLPTLPTGQIITVKNVSSATVVLSASGGDIDASSTYTLSAQWKYVTVISGGSGSYSIIANN